MQILNLKLSPYSSSSITLLCVFLFPLLCITQALTKLPQNESIPAFFMFGDSFVDTGNNNNRNTISKAILPPYGKDFEGGKPTGRFSNGKVPPDFVVEELSIKMLLPAYLDPNLQTEDLPTGVNFASGGAGYDPLSSEIASAISLSDQLDLFKEYIVKLERVVGNERRSTILATSFYAVVLGSNDITNTYFLTPLRRSQYPDFSSYADFLVRSGSNFVQDLYKMGARRIGVVGAPPCGCLPSQRTLFGGPKRDCVKKYNEAAQVLNTKLSDELKSLNSKLPRARIVYLDVYYPLLDMIQNPNAYGFEVADRGCCGTGTIEVLFLCSPSFVCTDVSRYLFWDSFHPTEKAYKLLVHQLLNTYINNFF